MPPAPPDAPLALYAEGLAMRFGRRRLFAGVSFAVRPGAPVAIVGANGSGKSTLLKILAGVLVPTAGRVALSMDGRTIPDAERPRRVGFVAPYLQLYDPLTARENLAFLARARRLTPARVDAELEAVGLAARADDTVGTFSTGMRQRLRVAAARLHDPPLLLLDEPSATLDVAGRELVRTLLDPGRLVVVATNDPSEVAWCTEAIDLG